MAGIASFSSPRYSFLLVKAKVSGILLALPPAVGHHGMIKRHKISEENPTKTTWNSQPCT